MKILHIASFNGNTGDIINHSGFEEQFKTYVSSNVEFIREEIRDYYKIRNLKRFDCEFVEYANKFDLIIIGGGNFLSPWLETSKNGTTFDISIEDLKKIKTPILFNAVGCEGSLGYTEKTINAIKLFFNYILLSEDSDKYFFTVRNDGSYDFIMNVVGEIYSDKVYEIPDNGFFCPAKDNKQYGCENKVIGLSVSEDRLKTKFNGEQYSNFIAQIKSVLLYYVEKSYNIKFIPHTYNDLFFLTDLYKELDDTIIRNNISVGSLKTNSINGEEVISSYLDCDLAIVMRFHASISCITLNKPFVALTLDDRVLELFHNLDLKNVINLNSNYNINDIFKILEYSSGNNEELLNHLKNKSSNVYMNISKWIKRKC